MTNRGAASGDQEPVLEADVTYDGAALPGTVAVVGLGVMGGSVVRALARLSGPPRIVVWSPEDLEMESARAEGKGVHGAATAEEAVRDADLVVYATPLGAAADLMEAHRRLWSSGSVITDVASLKAPLVARARALGFADRYVGSHPMAGSDGSGWSASRPDLYRDAPVWIATDTGSPEARSAVEGFWRALGARPAPCGAAEHDRRMVWASHLPQLVSNALAAAMDGADVGPADLGPGGRDATRLAGSSPAMWGDLLDVSGPDAAQALDAVAAHLAALSEALRAGRTEDVTHLMDRTRRWRRGEGTTP